MKVLFLFFLLLGFLPNSQAQTETPTVNIEVKLWEDINAASESNPKVFAYNETPDFAFGRYGSNQFKNYKNAHMAILEEYDVPQFVSHGRASFEIDAENFQAAFKQWEINNADKVEEIKTRIRNAN